MSDIDEELKKKRRDLKEEFLAVDWWKEKDEDLMKKRFINSYGRKFDSDTDIDKLGCSMTYDEISNELNDPE